MIHVPYSHVDCLKLLEIHAFILIINESLNIIFNLINFSLNFIAVPHLQGYCKKSGRDFEKSKGQDYINDSM